VGAKASSEEQWARLAESMAKFVGHGLEVDEAVYRSESETGDRNRAIAWMLKNFGVIEHDPMAALDNYFRQCSLLVTCQDLAYMAATLANGGVHPVTQQRALSPEHVDRVLSVMATCGMYDYAGSWLYEVGMPAKSGVGGGIIAVVPGRFGIGVFSPLLDPKGNSVRGIEACKALAADLGINLFSRAAHPKTALSRIYSGADAPSGRRPTPEMKAVLAKDGAQIKYLSLQGHLTVDGADYIVRRMRELAAETRFFILDMHLVVGISESAARMLNEARRELSKDGVAVVFSRIHRNTGVLERLRRSTASDMRGILCFEDNDLAVEWCENQLCAHLPAPSERTAELHEFPLFSGLPAEILDDIGTRAEPMTFAHGDALVTVGQEHDTRIFFIQQGQVSIVVPTAHGSQQRIASLSAGMSFGELMLLGPAVRSASVLADSVVSCLVLDAGAIDMISSRHPRFREILLANLARELTSTLRRATRWIGALA
jgi:glutaminase